MSNRIEIPLSSNELVFGLLVFFLSAFLVAESRLSRLHDAHAISSPKPVHLYLNQPADLSSLVQMLDDADLIKNRNEFLWAAHLLGWRRFREGHYFIDQGFDYDDFLSKLAKGIQDPVKVTILPGKTKGSIAESISHKLQFDSLAFQQSLSDTSFLANMQLDPKEVIGRLYPNTYSVYWTTSPKAFFKRVVQQFNRSVVQANKEYLQNSKRSLDGIITIASIVEWEAKNDDEKATISGLYWNRLDRGMRLQADPTVNYAIGERRRLLYEDYQVDHPYNTYLHRGLPPGPITNPSLSSIKAAMYPEDHQYLYMVASPDGTHAFSKTFKEHKRKSAEWRRWLQKQYRIKRQRERNSEE